MVGDLDGFERKQNKILEIVHKKESQKKKILRVEIRPAAVSNSLGPEIAKSCQYLQPEQSRLNQFH